MQKLKRNNFNQPTTHITKIKPMLQYVKLKKDFQTDTYKQLWFMLGVTRKIERKRKESFNQCNHSNRSKELNATKQGMKLTTKQKTQTPTGGSTYQSTKKPSGYDADRKQTNNWRNKFYHNKKQSQSTQDISKNNPEAKLLTKNLQNRPNPKPTGVGVTVWL